MALLGIIFAIVAPIIPSLLWLFFFLREDLHPEPRHLIMRAFNFGALVSVPVLIIQLILQQAAMAIGGVIVLIIGLAFTEELFKFLGARGAILGNQEFDEPTDAMIYMIAAALGFATVENFFITLQVVHSLGTLSFFDATNTLILRFVGATLLHTIASGIVGYYWAQSRLTGHRILRSGGIVLATALHAVFNYLVLRFENANLVYPSVFLLLALTILLLDFDKLKLVSLAKWKRDAS